MPVEVSYVVTMSFDRKANLEVLRDKDGISCDKSNLRYSDGEEDRISHPWSVQRATNV